MIDMKNLTIIPEIAKVISMVFRDLHHSFQVLQKRVEELEISLNRSEKEAEKLLRLLQSLEKSSENEKSASDMLIEIMHSQARRLDRLENETKKRSQ